MPYLVATVVVLAVFCAVYLLLTLAVLRRLREHERRFADLRGPAVIEPPVDRVPAFTTTTVDDRVVQGPDLGRSLVAFFSTDCVACLPEVPKLLRYLTDGNGYPRDRVLAVVAGADAPQGQRIVDQLREVADVVREPHGGPVCTAFATTRFPAYYVIAEGGDIRAAAATAAGLPHSVRA
jgi:hypothetical protein